MSAPLAHRFRRLAHLDLPGGGQVVVKGNYAYVGHMKPPHGTTILDVADPRHPRIVSAIGLGDDRSHTHKVRVNGDIMVTNVEQNNRHFARRGQKLAPARAQLAAELGRAPTDAEVGRALGVTEAQVRELDAIVARGPYAEGGFKVWDISDRARPRLLVHQKTGGVGVHRFFADARYAYISSEMDGYVGNILVIYDLADPARPREVARWWMPGQHVAGGETPTWEGQRNRLHHALPAGHELWAACWYGGLYVLDISDITQPRVIGHHNYHPPYPEPTHTILRMPGRVAGREIAIGVDEEHEHVRGQPHANLWVFDITDLGNIHPLSTFHVSELDSPWSRAGRFGAHQFQEHFDGTVVFCTWFAGGLRAIDVKDPLAPKEVGWFIPEPVAGNASPQSNDVDVDERGLVYVIDRNCGLDILEFTP